MDLPTHKLRLSATAKCRVQRNDLVRLGIGEIEFLHGMFGRTASVLPVSKASRMPARLLAVLPVSS